MRHGLFAFALPWILSSASFSSAQIPEQYPKPLVHTADNHPAEHILLLVVDGLHAFDLSSWVTRHPDSALAKLSTRGVTYTNAHSPVPNPVAGLLSITTGGTPLSTGILANNGYDHTLSPPNSGCTTVGTSFSLEAMVPGSVADAAGGPLDPAHGCIPLPPHALVRVNTIFEVVHEKVGPTAWADNSASLADLLRGPSGKGLDATCGSRTGDDARVDIVIHWIRGLDCSGVHPMQVPSLFGMDFTSFAAAQSATGAGYTDALRTPSAKLENHFTAIDRSIARFIAELKRQNLYDSTWIVVTSGYGGANRRHGALRTIPVTRLLMTANAPHTHAVANITSGGVAMLWLRDRADTQVIARALSAKAAELGIDTVITGDRLALTMNAPMNDPRAPDIVLRPRPGIVWSAAGHVPAEANGGESDDDTHVALLVSGAQLSGRADPTLVPITQIAPLLLRALGMEKFDLDALHHEHTPALPGIF